MQLSEFKDRMFNILNDTDGLPITDIIVNDRESTIKILLDDHSAFTITCAGSGSWFIQRPEIRR